MAKKILIVDDELHLVHILKFSLERAGYETVSAYNGRDGLSLANEHQPCLIVTDFQMPVMSGFDMAVKLYDDPDTCHLPLIMLTARGHKISPHEFSKTNIKALIGKPFSASDLIAKIGEVLGDHDPPQTGQMTDADHGEYAA